MNLFRLVVLVLLVVWVLRLLKTWQIRIERRDAPQASGGQPEVLRACARCGVMVPARSLDGGGRCGQCAASGR